MAYKPENRPGFFSPKGGAPYTDPLFLYFRKYLLQKAISVFEFTYPENWTRDQIRHFQNVLFTRGYIGIFEAPKFGVVALACSFTGQNLFYCPKQILVANPLLHGVTKTIGKDCVLFTLQETPSWSGYDFVPADTSINDIIDFYATQMAQAAIAVNTNLLNANLSYVFTVDNKASSEAFKKMYEQIISGEPAVIQDKNLLLEDGSPAWQAFQQNLGQNYIANDLLQTISNLNDSFCTLIGIPNTNSVEKKERVTNVEISQNNIETESLSDLWLVNLKRCCDEVNAMFNIGMSVEKRYKNKEIDPMREEDNGNDETSEP